MRRLLLVLAVLLLGNAATARAQAIVADIDFSTLDLGGKVINFVPIDDDGLPATAAWLLWLAPHGTTQTFLRVAVQQQDGALCLEAAFDPREGLSPFASVDVIRVGTRDMLKVIYSSPFAPAPEAMIRSLDRIRCR